MNILLDLFLTFAKIGLFTFGGGYAMIAMIENNCVERYPDTFIIPKHLKSLHISAFFLQSFGITFCRVTTLQLYRHAELR